MEKASGMGGLGGKVQRAFSGVCRLQASAVASHFICCVLARAAVTCAALSKRGSECRC